MSKQPTDDCAIATIGFTGKSAEHFFNLLMRAGVKRILDVRLNNTSQLAGFAKRNDLRYFLKSIANIEYEELQELAPEERLLKDYKNKEIGWDYYESKYIELLEKRSVEKVLSKDLLLGGCLLCSEHQPHHCHRRVALEYLEKKWNVPFNTRHLT